MSNFLNREARVRNAADDLLAALKAVVDLEHQDCGEPGCEICIHWQNAEKAITKAEGQEHEN